MSGRARHVLGRRHAAVLAGALGAALASSGVRGSRLEVQEWDCPPAPASCARPVVVRGFPAPYISDDHGVSPVGTADLAGALTGVDRFHAGALAADLALYAATGAAAMAVTRYAARRPLRQG